MGLTSKLDKLKLISSGGGDEPVGKSSQSGPENTDDIDEVDNEGQSILMGIIAQLRPGMDLSLIHI